MKCRDFKNEFEERVELNQTATLHLDSCANCQKYHFEQTKLWEMLGGLNRVEAPKDFNFQLKAKIARAKPSDYQQTGFFPALRFVLPLSAVLVLLSVVALSGLYFVNNNNVSSVAVSETPNPVANVNLPANSFATPNEIVSNNQPPVEEIAVNQSSNKQPEISNKKPEVAQNNKGGSKDFPNGKPKVITPNEKDSSGGGSKLLAGGQKPIIIQKEFDANRKVDTSVNPGGNSVININDLLKFAGIKTASLKVISIDKNSLAERSGVKIGDFIEEIDGEKVTGDSISGKQISVRNLTVLRNGERIEIVLRIN